MLSPEELVGGQLKLLTLPDIYIKVKALLGDADAGVADLAELIGTDPGMSARFLRVANSALFGFPSKIRTVNHAVTLMGSQQVHDIVLATSVTRAFNGISNSLESMDRFWQRSVLCGTLAQHLAVRCRITESERVFLQGLLREIGHLIMYYRAGDLCQRALQEAQQRGEPVYRMERDLFGFDYAAVGAALCRRWNFPPDLTDCVASHLEPQNASVAPVEAAVLHMAAIAADHQDRFEDIENWLDPAAFSISGLDAASVRDAWGDASEVARELQMLFTPQREAA